METAEKAEETISRKFQECEVQETRRKEVQQGKELDSLRSRGWRQEVEEQQEQKLLQLVEQEVRRSDHLCQEVRRLRK